MSRLDFSRASVAGRGGTTLQKTCRLLVELKAGGDAGR
jgi:hypothetical protein